MYVSSMQARSIPRGSYVRDPGLGFAIPGFIVGTVKSVGGALIKGGGGRVKKLAKDLAEAAAGAAQGNSAHADYLAFARANSATRYEYDNLRRPLENASREAKIASGLFSTSVKAAETPAEFFQQAVSAPQTRTALLVGGAVIAGLLLVKMLKK